MRTLILIGAAAALLAGCVSPAETVGRVLDRRVRGDADHALVPGYSDQLDALPFATAHCSRFNKATQFRRVTREGVLFACVKG